MKRRSNIDQIVKVVCKNRKMIRGKILRLISTMNHIQIEFEHYTKRFHTNVFYIKIVIPKL